MPIQKTIFSKPKVSNNLQNIFYLTLKKILINYFLDPLAVQMSFLFLSSGWPMEKFLKDLKSAKFWNFVIHPFWYILFFLIHPLLFYIFSSFWYILFFLEYPLLFWKLPTREPTCASTRAPTRTPTRVLFWLIFRLFYTQMVIFMWIIIL